VLTQEEADQVLARLAAAEAEAKREAGNARGVWRRIVRRVLRDLQREITDVQARAHRDPRDLTLAGELNALRRVRERWNAELATEGPED